MAATRVREKGGRGGGGETGSLNGAGMAEYRGGEGLGKRSPGSGGAQASSFHAKGHLVGIKLQKTPIDSVEHGEGEEEAQGTGEE